MQTHEHKITEMQMPLHSMILAEGIGHSLSYLQFNFLNECVSFEVGAGNMLLQPFPAEKSGDQ